MASRRQRATKTREMPAAGQPEPRAAMDARTGTPDSDTVERHLADKLDAPTAEAPAATVPRAAIPEAATAERHPADKLDAPTAEAPAAASPRAAISETATAEGHPADKLDAPTAEAPAAGGEDAGKIEGPTVRKTSPGGKRITSTLLSPYGAALGSCLELHSKETNTSVAEPQRTLTGIPPEAAEGTGVSARERGAAAWIVVAEGPDAGTRFPLEGEEVSVGRSRRCALRLQDPTVSRINLLLQREKRGWVARDPGAGNGVWVKGQPIRLHPLRDGDCLELGRSLLRFESAVSGAGSKAAAASGGRRKLRRRQKAQAAPLPREPAASEPGRRREGAARERGAGLVALALGRSGSGAGQGARPGPARSVWLLGGLLLCGLALGGLLWAQRGGEEASASEVGLPAHELFDAGLEALRAGEWEAARAHFDEAARLEPEAEEPARYASRLAAEEGAARDAGEARRCLDEGKVDCALAALDRIGSEGLVYEREGRALRLRIAAALGTGPEEAETASAAQAGEALQPSVGAAGQGQGGGQGAPPQGEGRERAEAAEGVERAGPGVHHGSPVSGAAVPRRRPVSMAAAQPARMARVRAAVASGDLDGALAALAASEERALAAELEGLRRVLDAKTIGPAELPALRQGLATLRKLGGSAPLEARIQEKLALGAARGGQAALDLGDLRAAYGLFREARAQDPGSREARRGLEFIRGRAQGLLVEGYALRSRQPAAAREKLLLARELSAEGEEIHEKAKKWLATLD